MQNICKILIYNCNTQFIETNKLKKITDIDFNEIDISNCIE